MFVHKSEYLFQRNDLIQSLFQRKLVVKNHISMNMCLYLAVAEQVVEVRGAEAV